MEKKEEKDDREEVGKESRELLARRDYVVRMASYTREPCKHRPMTAQ